jgi:hypothetical protein
MASQKIRRHESIAQNAKSISIQEESGMATHTGRSAIPQGKQQGKILLRVIILIIIIIIIIIIKYN